MNSTKETEMKYPVVYLNGMRLIAKVNSREDRHFPLVDPNDKGGVTFGHVSASGKIMSRKSQIGIIDDLQWTEEEEEMTDNDIMSGILNMMLYRER